MIPAHDSPLAALAFDASGTKLATASEKVRLPGPWKPVLAPSPVTTRALRGAPATPTWQGPLRALGVLLGAALPQGSWARSGRETGCPAWHALTTAPLHGPGHRLWC